MDNIIIEKTIEYVKDFFKNDFSGHDYYHSLRVYQNAVRIAEIENADVEIVSLAALLHDVDDYKLSPETACNMNNACAFLKKIGASGVSVDRICNIISQISFKAQTPLYPIPLRVNVFRMLIGLMHLVLLALPGRLHMAVHLTEQFTFPKLCRMLL